MHRVLLFAASLLACALLGGCTSIFLQPDRIAYYPKRPLGTPAEDVWITSSDGTRLHALRMPTPRTPKATILYLHGNAENLSTHAHLVSWLPAEGYEVLALDYREYGQSGGTRDIDGVHRDAEAALAWLIARGPARTGPIIVYGQSIGGSIAIRLVATSPLRAQVRALISDSAFSSYRRIAREKLGSVWLTWPLQWPLSLLVSDRHAAIDVVASISPIPLLLLHGDEDIVVDVGNAQRLFDAAREPKQLWIVPGGHHIDASFRLPIRHRLIAYLDQIVAPEAEHAPPASHRRGDAPDATLTGGDHR